MKRVFLMELKRAYNKKYLITIIFAMVLVILSAFFMLKGYFFRTHLGNWSLEEDWGWALKEGGGFHKNYHINAETMACFWIGMDFSTWCSTAFFFLLPLLAVLPHGGSLYLEVQSGYITHMVTQIPKRKYLVAKFLATFLAGGTVVLLPMLVNVLIVSCFAPLRMPEVSEFIYYGVYGSGLWASVFYSQPIIYIILYLLLDFAFAGAIATLPLSLSFVKNRTLALTLPFLFLLAFHCFFSILLVWQVRIGLSPLDFLRAANTGYGTNIIIVLGEWLVLMFPAIITIIRWGKKDVL